MVIFTSTIIITVSLSRSRRWTRANNITHPITLTHTHTQTRTHTHTHSHTHTQDGAHIYVCGDAVHMAGDVHEALLGVMEGEGELNREQAEQYMENLEKSARYQRDVWVT